MPAPVGWIREIVLNSPEPEALAGFWARLVGGAPVEWYDGWVTLEPPPHGQRLSFQRSDTPTEYGIHLMGCFFIVHHHGGRIEARSDDGQGTTFTLTIPVNPNKVPPAPAQSDFVQKVMLNQSLWEKLISSD